MAMGGWVEAAGVGDGGGGGGGRGGGVGVFYFLGGVPGETSPGIKLFSPSRLEVNPHFFL